MSLLSKHLFGQSFWVLKASPCTCSFVASWSFARSLSRDASATWSLNRTLGASKLLCFPGELLQCFIEAVLAIWYPETATPPSAVSAAVVPVFCSTATNFTFKITTARVKVKTARQPLEKMHVLQPALFLHPESQQRFRQEIAELPNCNLDYLVKVSSQEKNLNMTEGRHQRLLIAIEVWWSRLCACCQNIFLANLFGFWKASPCTCSFVASWSFARSLSRDASATWSLNRTLGASKLLCFPGELLQCFIEAVLANWYPETATPPSAVSAAVVPVFCSTATNFTFKITTARVKVKTARQPLEKMHVLQPALFLHPESQQRFRREIAELPNCHLDYLFKVSSQEKNLNIKGGRRQRLLIAIEVWWSRLWACCQNIFLANLFGFWKASPCTCSFVASWSFARSLSRDASATWSLKRTLNAP